MNDLITPARTAGAIAIFAIMFTAFGISLSNLSMASIRNLILVIFAAVMILGATGLVWNYFESF